ncbi:hypothetical protein YTPLAS18_34570 [Nitrospira sp.]|nr:hypothetical protein YTPLAS18_34570 [Nitrospira sp.]
MRKSTATGQIANEQGIALLAVMVILIMLTALGIAAITMTSMENTSAGYTRTNEAGVQAAEACVHTGAQVIQQVLNLGSIPATLALPAGPVVNTAALQPEILLLNLNNPDFAIGAGATPNLQMNVPTVNPVYLVTGDIDKDFRKQTGSGEFGKATIETFFTINCFAQNIATGSVTNVRGEYYCYTGEGDQGCKRQPT